MTKKIDVKPVKTETETELELEQETIQNDELSQLTDKRKIIDAMREISDLIYYFNCLCVISPEAFENNAKVYIDEIMVILNKYGFIVFDTKQ